MPAGFSVRLAGLGN